MEEDTEMSFRDRMSTGDPRMEEFVHIEITRRPKLLERLRARNTVIILVDPPVLIPQERVTKQMLGRDGERVPFTVPDFIFDQLPWPLPVYLDGPPHKRRGPKNRDDKIDELLRKAGFDPLRLPYSRPSENKARIMVDKIEERLHAA